MDPSNRNTWGLLLDKAKLRIVRTIALVKVADKLEYVRLIAAYQEIVSSDNYIETLVVEVEAELPQRVQNDIRYVEPIAIVVRNDEAIPEVYALRPDFPRLPHTNLRLFDIPKSLCLYENAEEQIFHFLPGKFFEDIRQWLSRSATDELHHPDQPLEPFALSTNPRLIVPRGIIDSKNTGGFVDVLIRRIEGMNGTQAFVCKSIAETLPEKDEQNCRLVNVLTPARTHGLLSHEPRTFKSLRQLLLPSGVDLLEIVRNAFKGIRDIPLEKRPNFFLLLVHLPRKRNRDGEIENVETWAFWFDSNVEKLGCEFGVWSMQDGRIGALLEVDNTKCGDDVVIESMNTSLSFDWKMAQETSGTTSVTPIKIVLIGCGALGSQIFMNMARMGIGEWTIIDDDMLLPHNLARHALIPGAEGINKAVATSLLGEGFLGRTRISSIPKRLPSTGNVPDDILQSLIGADLVIDASTSIVTSRALARENRVTARKVSLFLNPAGSDAVLLADDKSRSVMLDSIEMQYYRLLLSRTDLGSHLHRLPGGLRYSNSCRDISFILPQSKVAMFAGILSGALLKVITDPNASVQLWRANEDNWSSEHISIRGEQTIDLELDKWMLCVDRGLVEKIAAHRRDRLPNETGGVLLGTYDTIRKRIFLSDTILSPIDSIERMTSYIRGHKDLLESLKSVQLVTANQLEYVGEWHSHPRQASSSASDWDYDVLSWVADVLGQYGMPGLIVIAAETECRFVLSDAFAGEQQCLSSISEKTVPIVTRKMIE